MCSAGRDGAVTTRVLEMVTYFLRKSLEDGLEPDARAELVDSLMEEGHHPNEINAALTIVESIQRRLEAPRTNAPAPPSNRLFMVMEELHLPVEVRGYLTQLVDMGVLTPAQRDQVVERTLVMDPGDVTLGEVEALLEEFLSNEPRFPGQFDETVSDYYH